MKPASLYDLARTSSSLTLPITLPMAMSPTVTCFRLALPTALPIDSCSSAFRFSMLTEPAAAPRSTVLARASRRATLPAALAISVTHMSHIETGNTKLSLPVFVELAGALCVQADELLFDRGSERGLALAELSDTLDRCTAQQLRIVTDIVKAAKASLDKYHTP